jgi:plastocyanin
MTGVDVERDVDRDAARRGGIRPVLLLAQAIAAVAVVVALVVALTHTGSNPSASTSSGHGSHVWEYSVPFGTGQRIDAGENVSFFPAELNVRVGDQLVIHNDDNRSHQIGPYLVDRGETLQQTFTERGVLTGICTIHPSGRVRIVIR